MPIPILVPLSFTNWRREPNNIILEHFTPGEKPKNGSDTYHQICNRCGQVFSEGRREILLLHVTECLPLSQIEKADLINKIYPTAIPAPANTILDDANGNLHALVDGPVVESQYPPPPWLDEDGIVRTDTDHCTYSYPSHASLGSETVEVTETSNSVRTGRYQQALDSQQSIYIPSTRSILLTTVPSSDYQAVYQNPVSVTDLQNAGSVNFLRSVHDTFPVSNRVQSLEHRTPRPKRDTVPHKASIGPVNTPKVRYSPSKKA